MCVALELRYHCALPFRGVVLRRDFPPRSLFLVDEDNGVRAFFAPCVLFLSSCSVVAGIFRSVERVDSILRWKERTVSVALQWVLGALFGCPWDP